MSKSVFPALSRSLLVVVAASLAACGLCWDAQACNPPTYYDLTMQTDTPGGNQGTLVPEAGTHTYLSGTQVAIEATANAGWQFDHWACANDPIDQSTANPATITMNSNKVVTAVFTGYSGIMYTLTISLSGQGVVTPEPGEHQCWGGTTATVTAANVEGWVFSHWEGDAAGSDNPLSILMDEDKAITAVFVPICMLYTPVIGQGAVSRNPAGAGYPGGAIVELTAQPATNWVFDHWECPGDLDVDGATSATITVVVDFDEKTVTAVFRGPQQLEVGALGGGSVIVDPDPQGSATMVTGLPVTFQYAVNTIVDLLPVPDTGYVMDYWVKVGDFNTVDIEHTADPTSVMTIFHRTAIAMFKPEEGQTDTTTDFVVAVVGPGRVLIDYPLQADRVTSHVIADSVPAGETVLVTALPIDPAVGVFTGWQIIRNGETTFQASETFEITSDTTATAFYYDTTDTLAGPKSTVSTRVIGEGSINIGEGTFEFSSYCTPGNPLSGWNTVHLLATPAEGWVFGQWYGVADFTSPHVALSMCSGYSVVVEFIERPGIEDFDLVADLGEFLVDVGVNENAQDVENLEFDTGSIEYSSSGILLKPNGIPDAAELALLQAILQNPEYELAELGGASHGFLWRYYQANLARAAQDLPTLPEHIHRVTAAYMTLGSFGHREVVPIYLEQAFSVTVDPDSYELSGGHRFHEEGNVDNDRYWNIEEWQNVVAANEGVADMAAVARFVEAAMDRTDDGRDGTEEDPPPGTFFHGGQPCPIGSPEHQLLVVAATGAGVSYLPKGTVTLQSGWNHMEIAGYIVDPPGYEGVPLPVNMALTIALGRKIRVVMMGDERWFKTWSAPNTLIDGSPEAIETFRLGNATQTVRALKRGYKSFTLAENTGVTATCKGVGPLADAVYSEPDPLGGTRYFTPEGTYPVVAVSRGSTEFGESCWVGHMSFKEWANASMNHIKPHRTIAIINPEGVGWVQPGNCCCSWFQEDCPCGRSMFRYHINTADCGKSGLMCISGERIGTLDDPYTVGWTIVLASPEATFPVDFYYKWAGHPGYQHVRTYIYDKYGSQLQAGTAPLFGVGHFATSAANLPIRIQAEAEEKSKLSVDIRVDGIRPNMTIAQAGCFRGIDDSLKSRYRLPTPFQSPELVGIQALPNPGFVFVRWTGNCVPRDSNGTMLSGVSLDADADPANWCTNPVIYVKCLDPLLDPQDVNLTAVMRPCTHCGWGSTGKDEANKPKGTTVGGLVAAEELQDGAGYFAKPDQIDMYGCRWYIHALIKQVGEAWEQYRQDNRDPEAVPPDTGLLPIFCVTGVSLQNGGYREPSSSHQNGRDVDVRYIEPDGLIDLDISYQLIRLFLLLSDAKFVVIDTSEAFDDLYDDIVEEFDTPKVIRYAGHDDHFHVRFEDPDSVPPNDPCPPCKTTYP